jgi:hypothetical protein
VGAPCFDLAIERQQPPLQHRGRIALAAAHPDENRADVIQGQPGVAIGADLL